MSLFIFLYVGMLIFFDIDSTLCAIEWCDRLAARQGVGKHVTELTQATMDGKRSFDEVFISKTQLISPSRDDLHALWQEYLLHISPEMQDLITQLHAAGHTVWLLSQWYRESALIIAKHLDIPERHVHALVFDHHPDGSYAWFPEQALKYENGKTVILRELKQRFPDEKIIFIGDSVGDMIAGQQAHLFIWCGIHIIRERVHQEASHFVTDVDQLKEIIAVLHE